MKVGILGGTFDPIHNAHIRVAEEVMSRLGLAKVIFVPAGQPWQKSGEAITSAEHRAEMVRLAIAGKPKFELSAVEIERAGPTYTIDTIEDLQAQLGKETEIFFILGCDNLAQLHRWKDADRLIRSCRLVAVPRPGCEMPELDKLEEALHGISASVIALDKPEIDISATEVRKRAEQGLSIRGLVPDAVADYIKQHKLYLKR